ncbi:hypothetical protein MD484_g3836, partial [Candolleomyces efflorescens]
MVQASTLLVTAAFIIAPILAAPAPPHHHHKHIAADSAPVSAESSAVTRRTIDNPDVLDIEAREPNPFSFKKAFRGIARVAKKVAPIALKAAPLLLRRDEEGNLYVRELDADELALLEARDPKFNLGRTFRKIKGAVSKGLKVADKVVSTAHKLGLRELDDGLYLEEREFDPSSLDFEERDFEDLDELEARKFAFGPRFGKGPLKRGGFHRHASRDFDDEVMEVEARSLDELD